MERTLSLAIKDRQRLHDCQMSFLKDGGLFIPTETQWALGEPLSLRLDLMHEPEPILLSGRVAWITPPGAQGHPVVGVGMRFDPPNDTARAAIEAYLAGAVGSHRHTYTL